MGLRNGLSRLLVFALSILAWSPTVAADICEPSSQLRQAIAELTNQWACPPNLPCYKETLARAKALLPQHPDDFFLNRAYQSLVFHLPAGERETAVGEMQAPYAERARRYPDDPAAQYLGRHFIGDKGSGGDKGWSDDKERTRARDERFVKTWPEFPWGHLDLAEDIVKSRTWGKDPRERQIGEEQLATFMRLCPTRPLEPLSLMQVDQIFNGGNPVFWREHLPQLRGAVEAAPPTEIPAYIGLWNLEFAAAPPTDQEKVRARVKNDLARLKKLDLKTSMNWWTALHEGYRLAGDERAARRAEDGMIATFPCDFQSVQIRLRRWREDHEPEEDAPGDEEEDYDALYRATDRWLKSCPDELQFRTERIRAVTNLPDITDEQALKEVDLLLANWEKVRDSHMTTVSPYWMAANLLVTKGLALERVPGLVERENARIEEQFNAKNHLTASGRPYMTDKNRLTMETENSSLATQAYIGLGRTTLAAERLAQMKERLSAIAKMAGPHDPNEPRENARYWRLRGDLAAAEGEKRDALGFYGKAQAIHPTQEVDERAVRVWKETGGNDEAWKTFVEAARDEKGEAKGLAPNAGAAPAAGGAAPNGWTAKNEPLAPFELVDMKGHTWRPENLKGKVALINVWATWCGPCRAELPLLEELYEKVAGRPEIVILTFNADRQSGLVGPYLKQSGWRFPVLLAYRHLVSLSGPPSLPQNWIVDRDGVVRYVVMGFDTDWGDEWTGKTLKLLESVDGGDRQSAKPTRAKP